MSNSLAERERYTPDGKTNSALTAAAGLAALVAVVIISGLLNLLYFSGGYYFMVIPVLAGLALSGALCLGVRFSHCRNPRLAGLFGGFCGLLTMLAFFYWGMWVNSPPGVIPQPQQLSRYIHERMLTQVVDEGRGGQNAPDAFGIVRNYFMLLAETGMLIAIPLSICTQFASRPYSTELGRWFTRSRFNIRAGMAETVVRFWEAGNLDEFAQILASAKSSQKTSCDCAVDYINLPDESPLEHPVYLSLQNNPMGFWGKGGISAVRLTVPECVALRPLFPKLAKTLAARHSELRGGEGEAVLSGPARSESPPDPSQLATITPLENESQGNIVNWKRKLKVAAVCSLPAIWLIASIPVGIMIALSDIGPFHLINPGVLVIVSGLVGLMLYLFWYRRSLKDVQWCRYVVAELQSRTCPLVSIEDEDILFINVVDFNRSMSKRRIVSADIGLCRLDQEDRTMFIEGDRCQYQIPGTAVIECKVTQFMLNRFDLYTAELLLRTTSGVQPLFLELMLPRLTACGGRCYQRKVAQFCESILALRG